MLLNIQAPGEVWFSNGGDTNDEHTDDFSKIS